MAVSVDRDDIFHLLKSHDIMLFDKFDIKIHKIYFMEYIICLNFAWKKLRL